MNQDTQWIVTVDGRHASLFSCRMIAGNRWHVELKHSFDNAWENSHERSRPNRLDGGLKGGAAHHAGGFGHEAEEEELRFAREVSLWLKTASTQHGAAHLRVFAARKCLGLLRGEIAAHGGACDLHECELTHLNAGELASHPTVVAALERRDRGERR